MTKSLRGLMIAFLLLNSPCVASGLPAGQVAFFFFVDPIQSGEYSETLDDFVFFYRGVLPWLDEHGITHSYHSSLPVHIERTQGSPVTFQNESLSGDLGTILLKQDGSYRILHGVYTGVDLILEIQQFFRFERQAE